MAAAPTAHLVATKLKVRFLCALADSASKFGGDLADDIGISLVTVAHFEAHARVELDFETGHHLALGVLAGLA